MTIRQKHYAKAFVPNISIIVKIFTDFKYALGTLTVGIYVCGSKS